MRYTGIISNPANPQTAYGDSSVHGRGDISLGKAAMLMGVSHAEMQDIVVEHGAQIHLGPLTAHELRKDAKHA